MTKIKHINWDAVELGTKPDTVIAREHGVRSCVVAKARTRRNIPAFSGSGYTYEGYPCKSGLEAMYDAYLHGAGVAHQHEVRVPGTPYRADVLLDDGVYVEIIGMVDYARYAKKWQKKLKAYADAGFVMQVLTVSDVETLYAGAKLPALFAPKKLRVCPSCKQERSGDFSNGVCRHCYNTLLLEKPTKTGVCATCGKQFSYKSYDHENKYCSHSCYAVSLQMDWPSDKVLSDFLETRSYRDLAQHLGRRPGTVYTYLTKRGLVKRERPTLSKLTRDEWVAAFQSSGTVKGTAKALGVSKSSAGKYLRDLGVR